MKENTRRTLINLGSSLKSGSKIIGRNSYKVLQSAAIAAKRQHDLERSGYYERKHSSPETTKRKVIHHRKPKRRYYYESERRPKRKYIKRRHYYESEGRRKVHKKHITHHSQKKSYDPWGVSDLTNF
jgi:hypothetical protein